jgi:hypothetical protein
MTESQQPDPAALSSSRGAVVDLFSWVGRAKHFPHCRAVPASRLPVHWQAHLPKRAQAQAEVRTVVSFWFDDSKTHGAAERCRGQKLMQTEKAR